MSLIIERRASYFVLTLDHQDKLNVLSAPLLDELREAFDEIENRPALRCAILTGAGERAFCAGTDINQLTQLSEKEAGKVSVRGQQLCNQIENCGVPVIAAVNGIAAGGGCELALACHIRIASENALFSLPETKLGIIPAYGGTQRLAREIGQGRALEMMLTGRTVSATEALQFGLINGIAPAGELLATAESLAREIAGLAPLAIRACLEAVIQGADLPLAEGLALEARLFAGLFASEDVREGTRAFMGKRSPIFKGR
jgi:enoyl-CoA hydratase